MTLFLVNFLLLISDFMALCSEHMTYMALILFYLLRFLYLLRNLVLWLIFMAITYVCMKRICSHPPLGVCIDVYWSNLINCIQIIQVSYFFCTRLFFLIREMY